MPFAANTTTPPRFALTGGKVRQITRTFNYASDTAGAYPIPDMILPAGAVPIAFILNTSVSTGTATLALGIAGTAAKYAAAAALTATDTPTFRMLAAAGGTAVTTAEQIILTTASANLPANGQLDITLLYSQDN